MSESSSIKNMDPYVQECKNVRKMIRSSSLKKSQIVQAMAVVAAKDHDDQRIRPRIMLLNEAHTYFSIYSPANGSSSSNFKYERYYQNLYKDLYKHEDIWFNEIFYINTPNPELCEYATGILGTLCTIRRQRGDLKGCMNAMRMYEKVLQRFKDMSALPGVDKAQLDCSKDLDYKYHLIRINCGLQLDDRNMAISSLRAAIKYEQAPHFNQERFWSDLFSVFNIDLNNLTEDKIYSVLALGKENVKQEKNKKLELRQCGHCEKQEKVMRQFNLCARCHTQAYCSKDCQKKDWKLHKILCGANNTTKVDSESLREVAKLLTENYAETVFSRTGKTVTKAQRKAAIPGLLKMFKQALASDFSHFNSNSRFADAGQDPAFNKLLVDYFQKQPGYEAWVELGDEYQNRAEQDFASQEKIRFDEETVQDIADKLAIAYCAAMKEQDVVKREKLKDRLVATIKAFALTHPKYNSHRGLYKMKKNPEFVSEISAVCMMFASEMDD